MSRTGFALLVGLFAALAGGAYYLGHRVHAPTVPASPPAPAAGVVGPLAVEEPSLDLGEVWEEPAYTHTLSLHNRSAREVKVADVATSCGCVSVSPRSFAVPPGGIAQLDVTLDLTKRSPVEIGRDVRPLSAAVSPIISGARSPGERANWTLAGQVKSRVTLDILALDFGERPIAGEPAEPREVTAMVHVPVQGLKVTTDEVGVTATASPLGTNGYLYTIALRPDTTALKPGRFKATATISVITPAGKTLFGARLPVEGVVRPEASLLPACLILGPRPVGETATGTLVLQGRAGKDVVLRQIETDSPDVTIAPVTVEGEPGTRAWRVTQRVSKPGDQSNTARFVFTKAGRQITTTVVISSFGEETATAGRPTDHAGEEKP